MNRVKAMRVFLLSSNITWVHKFSQMTRTSGWSLEFANTIEDFKEYFNDALVDILVAESIQGASLIDTLRQLRSEKTTCAVVWVNGESVSHAKPLDYAEFADRRVDPKTPWVEWRAILLALLAILRRYGWR